MSGCNLEFRHLEKSTSWNRLRGIQSCVCWHDLSLECISIEDKNVWLFHFWKCTIPKYNHKPLNRFPSNARLFRSISLGANLGLVVIRTISCRSLCPEIPSRRTKASSFSIPIGAETLLMGLHLRCTRAHSRAAFMGLRGGLWSDRPALCAGLVRYRRMVPTWAWGGFDDRTQPSLNCSVHLLDFPAALI